MTDRERLIELMQKQFTELYKDGDWNFNEMLVGVADYLLANGVIVPPCKVGDTVYSIQGFNGKVENCEPYTVTEIYVSEHDLICVHITDCWLFTRNMYKEDFGKTVFLTKEEAEQALKEREQNA